MLLLPPDMRDWLPEDDLVYFIIDVVKELDLSEIYAHYDGSQGGQPPYDPVIGAKANAHLSASADFVHDHAYRICRLQQSDLFLA